MKKQPASTAAPPTWKWCARCESAFDLEKASWHTLDASLTVCPLCGASASDWLSWEEFRTEHPEYPAEPTDRAFYPRAKAIA
jgi:hypothetical protein